MVVNVPLALGLAWLVSLVWPKAFTATFVAGYWLTNLIGLVMLRRGAAELRSDRTPGFSPREILKDLAVAMVYTLVILLLAKERLLQPIQYYLHPPP